MACVNCRKIRTALLHGKMAEAAGLTIEAMREKIGWKAPLVATTSERPPLDGMLKGDMLEQAQAEGVDVDDSATKAQIVEAVEQHRLDEPV